MASLLYEAVCSPFRHPLGARERRMLKAGMSKSVAAAARTLARRAHVAAPELEWELAQPPTFANSVATLELDGRTATLTIEQALPDWREPTLAPVLQHRLA